MALVVTMASCAASRPAAGSRVGSKDRYLGDDRWLIRIEEIGPAGRNAAIEATYRRAAELCPDGFDPIDSDHSTRDYLDSPDGGGTIQVMERSNAMLIVQCRLRQPVQGRPTRWCTSPPGIC